MAKKKKKVKVDRLVLLGLIFAALLCVFIIGVYSAIQILSPSTSDSGSGNSSTSSSEITDSDYNEKGYTYSVVSSITYKTGLNYDFSIVTLNLSGNLISADLSDFTTSDDINLGEVESYIQYFKNNNIDMNYDYVTSIASSGSNEVVSIFVPIASTTLTITNGKLSTDININKNTVTIRNEELDPVSYNVDLTVNDGFSVSYIQVDNQDFTDYNAFKFYAFKLTINSNPNNLTITSGSYLDGNGIKYELQDSSVSSLKLSNLIGEELNEDDGLFIKVASDDGITKSGNLTLNFSDGTTITYEVKIQ